MKLVIDTNEIFSFFNQKSKARELALLPYLELYSPEFALVEIEEHKIEIMKKFSLSEAQFLFIMKLLKTIVKFSKENEYSEFLAEAVRISPDPDDVDFFALALMHSCSLWSEEVKLKQQSRVRVINTGELIEKLES